MRFPGPLFHFDGMRVVQGGGFMLRRRGQGKGFFATSLFMSTQLWTSLMLGCNWEAALG